MNVSEKENLVKLLNLYMNDLLEENKRNAQKSDRAHKKNEYGSGYVYGIKSQFNHARILTAKLSTELEKEIKANWELY